MFLDQNLSFMLRFKIVKSIIDPLVFSASEINFLHLLNDTKVSVKCSVSFICECPSFDIEPNIFPSLKNECLKMLSHSIHSTHLQLHQVCFLDYSELFVVCHLMLSLFFEIEGLYFHC